MPELASITRAGVSPTIFQPINPASYYQAPVADVSAANRISGQSAIYGSIAKVLSELPDQLLASYQKGREAKTGNAIRTSYENALAGNPDPNAPLYNFKAYSDGKVAFSATNPDLDAANIYRLNHVGQPKPKTPSIWERRLQSHGLSPGDISAPVAPEPELPTGGASQPSSDPVEDAGTTYVPPANGAGQLSQFAANGAKTADASVFGLVPDGKGNLTTNDPNDKTDAGVKGFSATKGAWGANIKDPNLSAVAVSPADLAAAGVDLKNPQVDGSGLLATHVAQVTLPDGTVREYPIADKLGHAGRVDFTGAAYRDAGGPMDEKNGGLIKGVKFAIVPKTGVPLADQQAIEGASVNIGQQLANLQPEEMSAANAPGAPAANASTIQPVTRQGALATFAGANPNQPVAASAAPSAATHSAAGKETVDRVTGVVTLESPDGKKYQLLPYANSWREVKPPAGATVPAAIRSEAVRMGVWKEGMTSEDAAKAMETKQISDGVIPPHLLPAAGQLARMVLNHPTLKHYPAIREAKEAIDAGLANPGTGGFSDMALVEGFQRMINPGATVRAQTIDNMMSAAGWLQKFDPKYNWNKAIQGDKFSDDARQRIKKLSDDIFERATKNVAPQMNALKKVAKSFGVSNPDDFVSNVLVVSPLYDASGNEVPLDQTPGSTPAAPVVAGAPQPSPKDMEAAAWVKANPTHPKAASVKAALQAKGIPVN